VAKRQRASVVARVRFRRSIGARSFLGSRPSHPGAPRGSGRSARGTPDLGFDGIGASVRGRPCPDLPEGRGSHEGAREPPGEHSNGVDAGESAGREAPSQRRGDLPRRSAKERGSRIRAGGSRRPLARAEVDRQTRLGGTLPAAARTAETGTGPLRGRGAGEPQPPPHTTARRRPIRRGRADVLRRCGGPRRPSPWGSAGAPPPPGPRGRSRRARTPRRSRRTPPAPAPRATRPG